MQLELARVLRNYQGLSADHAELYNFFLTTTGLDLLDEFNAQHRGRAGAALPTSTGFGLPARRSRSNSPVPMKRVKAETGGESAPGLHPGLPLADG